MTGRPSVVTDEARAEIIRIATEYPGTPPTKIARALNKSGYRTSKKKRYERHHIRAILEPRTRLETSKSPSRAPAAPGHGTNRFSAPVLTAAKTPVHENGADPRMVALPSSVDGVTTQSKREQGILLAEEAVGKAYDRMISAVGEDVPDAVRLFLASLLAYDRLLTSAEKAEFQHAKTIQQLFVINPTMSGSAPDGSSLPSPDDVAMPAAFTQAVQAEINRLGKAAGEEDAWNRFLERLQGEQDVSSEG